MVPQQYCLRWKHHHSNVQSMFAQLLEKERFCDVTLYCSPNFATQVPNKDTVEPQKIRGVSLRAHRVVLAACSDLLAALLAAHEGHGEPVLVIDGAEPKHLRALLDYMYTGEMNVHHSQLASLLKTAEELRIKGLTDIRWNNKDEPPDCNTGAVTTTTTERQPSPEHKPAESKPSPRPERPEPERGRPADERRGHERRGEGTPERADGEERAGDRFSVNGGPPPLIKLPTKEKSSPVKREKENSDSDSTSPKRRRLRSENTDEELLQPKLERDPDTEWQHGNLDITAEKVSWAASGGGAGGGESDEEWEHAPADIGSFLRTRLKVDGDNSADEDSDDSAPTAPHAGSSASSGGTSLIDLIKPAPGSKGTRELDPRFTDVVKLNDYLQHGRRPQFWEENYVKRVMEAVRIKELEMKQAAEILGVSYGTLYGRYRDVYGCINRPYRTARDFWQAKGPSEVLDRLQRGDLTLEAAALALGVNPSSLAAYVSDLTPDKEFEHVPIEIEPSLKGLRARTYSASTRKTLPTDKKALVGAVHDEDLIPATVISTAGDGKAPAQPHPSGKWPSIRVASLDSLRGDASPSPMQLMRTRPDLTIVAARRDRQDDST